ncbi:MAG: AmpG family muropeptide MFS transporter [Alphaproteobacteria bacterium]
MTDLSARPVRSWQRTLRVYSSPRLLFVFVMGFASGLPLLLTGGTLSIWMAELGVALTTIGLFAFVGTPYNFKFLWAPIVDRVPLPWLTARLGRRRGWMLVIQGLLLAAIAALGLTDPLASPLVTAALTLVVAFFSASQDIVIDAYRIEILDEAQQAPGVAMTQAGYRIGLIAAGAGALYLADWLEDWSIVYALMALLVLVGMLATLLAPVPDDDRAILARADGTTGGIEIGSWFRETLIAPFAEFVSRNGLGTALIVLGFVLLYKLGDAFAGVMANPFYVLIGFTKSEIASVSKIFGVAASLAGVFLGSLVVVRYGVLKSLLGCGILQMFSNLMFALQAHVGAEVWLLFFTIGIENFSGGLGSAAFVAYLSLLANRKFTGTQFALLTSLMATGRTMLSAVSGYVADQTDWTSFFIISTFVALPGLLLLLWMMRHLSMDRQVHGRAAR